MKQVQKRKQNNMKVMKHIQRRKHKVTQKDQQLASIKNKEPHNYY